MTRVFDKPCVVCGEARNLYNSDHESTVHDLCGVECDDKIHTLAANLATVGGLALSPQHGVEFGVEIAGDPYEIDPRIRRPGCGKAAPGFDEGRE